MPENLVNINATDNPWRDSHDLKTTTNSIKEILKHGTPRWVSNPKEYKNYAQEAIQAEKELSDDLVSCYKMQDQDLLTNEHARVVRIKRTRDIVKLLRDNGVRCYTIDNGMPQTVGLWAFRPYHFNPTYVCYLQIPYMCEWSVLRLDRHDLPAGESYRGWRTMIGQLIVKGIITERKAHEIFGAPTESPVSKLYRRTLFNYRNGILRTEDDTNE